ncbi:MAG: chromate efflux transporter [Verrucomicrobiales bacterium]|nr:chromate efflux transporter [Verrucomicrobiales bacterium]
MKNVLEVLREFFLLGLTSFGGPTAHVAFFRDRFVGVKKWLTESEFADQLALCQFLPGPASSQLGLTIGWRRAGWAGALAAWTGFTLPSALAITAFGIGVTAFGGGLEGAGWLRGLQIAVVVVIANAVTSMWKGLCPGNSHKLVALAAAGIILATSPAWMQIVVIALGAVAGLIFLRDGSESRETFEKDDSTGLDEGSNPVKSSYAVGITCLVLFFVLLFGLPLLTKFAPGQPLEAFTAMYRSGSLVFGGGHVVLPLLSEEVVGPGWVTREEFLAGYGAAQAVPGPLFTFSAFLGSLIEGPGGAWGMALVSLLGIFLPAWLLVMGVMPFWHGAVRRPGVRSALAGTNAAVVGLLGAALYDPVWVGAIQGATDVVFLLGVAAALLVLKWPSWLVVVLAAVAGWGVFG